jgi:hypothetical protein
MSEIGCRADEKCDKSNSRSFASQDKKELASNEPLYGNTKVETKKFSSPKSASFELHTKQKISLSNGLKYRESNPKSFNVERIIQNEAFDLSPAIIGTDPSGERTKLEVDHQKVEHPVVHRKSLSVEMTNKNGLLRPPFHPDDIVIEKGKHKEGENTSNSTLSDIGHRRHLYGSFSFIHRFLHPDHYHTYKHHAKSVSLTTESVEDLNLSVDACNVSQSHSESRKTTLISRLFRPSEEGRLSDEQTNVIRGVSSEDPKGNNDNFVGIGAKVIEPDDSPVTRRKKNLLMKLFNHMKSVSVSQKSGIGGHSTNLGSQEFTPSTATKSRSSDEDVCASNEAIPAHEPPIIEEDELSNSKNKVSKQQQLGVPPEHHLTLKKKAFNIVKQLSNVPQILKKTHSSHTSHVSDDELSNDNHSLHERYGQAEKIIGRGAGGVVRLFYRNGHTGPNDKMYAVKVF